MPSYKPKERKRYRHYIIITSVVSTQTWARLEFTSEKEARRFEKSVARSISMDIVTDYEKKELTRTDDGFLL